MRTATVYNATPQIEAAFHFKKWPFDPTTKVSPAFPDTTDPVVQIEGFWLAGWYPILGYLDRRKPLPYLLPQHDAIMHAHACMLLDDLLSGQVDDSILDSLLGISPYVLGQEPCFVDMLVVQRASDSALRTAHADRVKEALNGFA